MTRGQHVKVILLSVKLTVREPEADAADRSDDSHGTVVPHQERVRRQRVESLSNGSRDGRHEESKRRHQRTHVLGRLRESVLERRDRGKNLRNGNQHVRSSLRPHIDVDIGAVLTVRVASALTLLVDVSLHNARPHHGQAARKETGSNLLNGGKLDARLAQSGVDEDVEDWDEDDQRKGVKIGQDVVGDAMESHDRGLGRQIVVDLVVGYPIERIPEENAARLPATADLIDPGVIESHPSRLGVAKLGRLKFVPESAVVTVLVKGDRVDGEPFLGTKHQKLDSRAQDASFRLGVGVPLAAEEEHRKSDAEKKGWKHEGKIETNVALSIGHAELTDEGANVDEEVEPVVDPRSGHGGVDNDTLALLCGVDVHLAGDLLSDQG